MKETILTRAAGELLERQAEISEGRTGLGCRYSLTNYSQYFGRGLQCPCSFFYLGTCGSGTWLEINSYDIFLISDETYLLYMRLIFESVNLHEREEPLVFPAFLFLFPIVVFHLDGKLEIFLGHHDHDPAIFNFLIAVFIAVIVSPFFGLQYIGVKIEIESLV